MERVDLAGVRCAGRVALLEQPVQGPAQRAQLAQPPVDFLHLLRRYRAKPRWSPAGPGLLPQPNQFLDLRQGESEGLCLADEAHQPDGLIGVFAISAGTTTGRTQEATAFIEPKGVGGHTCRRRHIANPEDGVLLPCTG